jgi:hypothetical protein
LETNFCDVGHTKTEVVMMAVNRMHVQWVQMRMSVVVI